MSAAESGAKFAARVLSSLFQEVAEWADGKGTRRPRVLSILPNELQSEVSQRRLEARYEAGLEKRPEAPKVDAPQLVAPDQVSHGRITTEPVNGEG